MRPSSSIVAVALLLVSWASTASTKENANGYEATLDPPTGSIHCGFSLSGVIKSPKPEFLSYGFFFRSELNIDSDLNPRHPLQQAHFTGPGTLRVAEASKDFGDDSLLQKHKTIQAQLRVWFSTSIIGSVGGGGPQVPPLFESAWVNVPSTAPGCAADRMRPLSGVPAPSGNK